MLPNDFRLCANRIQVNPTPLTMLPNEYAPLCANRIQINPTPSRADDYTPEYLAAWGHTPLPPSNPPINTTQEARERVHLIRLHFGMSEEGMDPFIADSLDDLHTWICRLENQMQALTCGFPKA